VTAAAGRGGVRAPDRIMPRPVVRDAAQDPERGAGTVLTLGLVAAAATGLLLLSLLASAQSGRSAAQAAADLAALAVAEQIAGGFTGESAREPTRESAGSGEGAPVADDPRLASACAVGRATAEANGCVLTSCEDRGAGVVEVTASRRTIAGVARAAARAGPLVVP
jgi:hypothetical protein